MKLLSPRERERHARELSRSVSAFQSPVGEIESIPDPPIARATLWTLVALLFVATVWSAFSTLDRIVIARGELAATVPSIMVQPLENAIVKTLDAAEGDVVRAGQVLMTLDPTFAEADVGQIEVQANTLDAQIARLEAEIAGQRYTGGTTPEALLQLKLHGQRQAEYEASVRGYDDKIAGLEAAIKRAEGETRALTDRHKGLSEIESMRDKLAKSEAGSRLNALAARDSRLDVARDLAIATNQSVEYRHQLDAMKSERQAFIGNWQNKTLTELATARRDRGAVEEQLAKARRRGELVTLTSPVDAIVQERADRAVGSVLRGAEPVFVLIPLNAPLEAEVRIDGRDIGFVRVGDPVNIKLDAYHYLEHGTLEGEVRTISEDTFKDKEANIAYYKARIRIKEIKLRGVPANFRLLPGLPLTGDVKVGERTILSYFLRPILRGFGEAMREP